MTRSFNNIIFVLYSANLKTSFKTDNRKSTLLMILLMFAIFESPEVIKIPKALIF